MPRGNQKRKRDSPLSTKTSKVPKPYTSPQKTMTPNLVPSSSGDGVDPRNVDSNEVNDLITLNLLKRCKTDSLLGKMIANGGDIPSVDVLSDALQFRAKHGEVREGADIDYLTGRDYGALREELLKLTDPLPDSQGHIFKCMVDMLDRMYFIVESKVNDALSKIASDNQVTKEAAKEAEKVRRISEKRKANRDRLADSDLRLTLHNVPVPVKDGMVDRSKLVDSVKSFAPSISNYISSNISVEPLRGKPKDLNSNTIPILLTAPNRETRNILRQTLLGDKNHKYQVSNHYTAELYSLIKDIRTQAENKYNKDQILVSLSAAGNSLNIKRRQDSNQKWTLVENTQLIPLTRKDLEELNIDKDPVIFNSFCIKRSPGSAPSTNIAN